MEKRLFFLINLAQHRLFQHVDLQAKQELGISATQVAGVLFLAKNNASLQRDLATALGLNKAAASTLTARMEANGLVERQPCESDGRAWRIALTGKAKTLLPAIRPLLLELNQALTEGFSEEEIRVVLRFLNHVLNRFSNHTKA